MNIFVISNTKFGFRNRFPDQLDYFYNQFIPFLDKNKSDDNVIIHLGNVFNTKNSVNFKILNEVYNLFDTLSSKSKFYLIKGVNDIFSLDIFKKINNLHIIDNELVIGDYLFFNQDYLKNDVLLGKEYKYCFSGFFENGDIEYQNIVNVFSPYQLIKNYNNNGFYFINDSINFIFNDYSPCFREMIIENIEQLKSIEQYKKDIINLKITSKLINKKEVSLFLSNYKINTIEYLDIDIGDDMDDTIVNSDVKNTILEYISKNGLDLGEEVQKVFKIRNKKNIHV